MITILLTIKINQSQANPSQSLYRSRFINKNQTKSLTLKNQQRAFIRIKRNDQANLHPKEMPKVLSKLNFNPNLSLSESIQINTNKNKIQVHNCHTKLQSF